MSVVLAYITYVKNLLTLGLQGWLHQTQTIVRLMLSLYRKEKQMSRFIFTNPPYLSQRIEEFGRKYLGLPEQCYVVQQKAESYGLNPELLTDDELYVLFVESVG